MNKKILLAGLLLSVMLLVPVNSAYSNIVIQIHNKPIITSNRGNTLYVGGNGTGNYSKIQDAIDNASDGDTVFVYDDSSPYYENVVIDKSINLVGENRDSTVIDAKDDGTPIIINADDVSVSKLNVRNMEDSAGSAYDYAVIQVRSFKNIKIDNNIIYAGDGQTPPTDWFGAIDIDKCNNCVISNNVITQDDYHSKCVGIRLYDSSNNIISGNDISNYTYGIGSNSEDNILSENYIHYNKWGIDFTYGNHNEILNNTIDYNSRRGINIDNSHHNTIKGNFISNNGDNGEFECGIMLSGEECSDNIVSDNIISYNKPCGLQIIYSYDTVITRNNFIDNYGDEGTPERWWGNAYFCNPSYTWRFFNMNSWTRNYWSDLSSNIRIIKGTIEFLIFNIYLPINWIEIEWNPAKEPYNI